MRANDGKRSKIFCLRVEPLYSHEDKDYLWQRVCPMPSLCVCNFTPEFLATIEKLHTVLMEHELTSVSQRTTAVEWFHKRTDHYVFGTNTQINVTETTVSFSGWHPPHQAPYFQSSTLPLSEVLDASTEFKRIDLGNMRLPIAQGLIDEIVSKDEELNKLLDRSNALDELEGALLTLDSCATGRLNSDLTEFESSLLSDVANIQRQIDQLELDIRQLNRRLLRRCLAIRVGDWIISDGSDYSRKTVRLQVAEVDYYDKKLCISGPLITQKGEVGKRTESIYISVLPDDEY